MGIFSKLLGSDANAQKAEKAAKDLLGGIMNSLNEQANKRQQNDSVSERPARSYDDDADSVWDVMPSEPNQYNYQGSFTQYFESIFATELSGYTVEKNAAPNLKRVIYTFYNDGRRALVIELMSDSCSAKKVREDCRAAGVPYLRFYIDHQGWWNTRTYVAGRIRNAIG